MTDRYKLERQMPSGFLIRDRDCFDWAVAQADDEATAKRIVRLLNEEEHFQSQEPDDSALRSAIHEGAER